MARPLRIQFKNGWYHVTASGTNQNSLWAVAVFAANDAASEKAVTEVLNDVKVNHAIDSNLGWQCLLVEKDEFFRIRSVLRKYATDRSLRIKLRGPDLDTAGLTVQQ